jgi:hypothetical protein
MRATSEECRAEFVEDFFPGLEECQVQIATALASI